MTTTHAKSPTSSEPARPRRTVAFTCPRCKRPYGDGLYHGPAGHAPPEMCFDCWAAEWAEMTAMMDRGGPWEAMDAALYLLCQGLTYRQAADLIGVHRRRIIQWIRTLRRRPGLLPDWLADAARGRWKLSA